MSGNSKQLIPLIINLLVTLIICLESTAQDPEVAIQPTVLNIISKLVNEKTVHLGDPLGLTSIPDTTNKYYKLYKKLGEIATDKELLTLTNDSLNVIVVYSFSILHSRNYVGLKEVFLKHLTDTTRFELASGCTGEYRKVNSFMFWKLSPPYYQTSRIYLTTEELGKYYELIENL